MPRPPKVKALKSLVEDRVLHGRLRYSAHANQRMRERGIIKPEVERVLLKGRHEAAKDAFNELESGWDYAFRGKTVDGRELRIVVAIEEPNVLVVTAIDLSK